MSQESDSHSSKFSTILEASSPGTVTLILSTEILNPVSSEDNSETPVNHPLSIKVKSATFYEDISLPNSVNIKTLNDTPSGGASILNFPKNVFEHEGYDIVHREGYIYALQNHSSISLPLRGASISAFSADLTSSMDPQKIKNTKNGFELCKILPAKPRIERETLYREMVLENRENNIKDKIDCPLIIKQEALVEEKDSITRKYLAKGFKKRKTRWIWFGLLNSIIICLFITLIILYFTYERTGISIDEAKLKFKNSIIGKLRIRKIDTNLKVATGDIKYFMGEELRKKYNSKDLILSYEKELYKWDWGIDMGVYIKAKENNFKILSGTTADYPFDAYRIELDARAILPDKSTAHIVYYFDNSILLYRTQIKSGKPGVSSILDIYQSTTTIALTVLITLIFWGFAASYSLLAIKILVFKIPVVVQYIQLGALLLFNADSFRQIMPNIPKVGVFIDSVSFFWYLGLILISFTIIILTGYICDLYVEPQFNYNPSLISSFQSVGSVASRIPQTLEQQSLLTDYEFSPQRFSVDSIQSAYDLKCNSNDRFDTDLSSHSQVLQCLDSQYLSKLSSIGEKQDEASIFTNEPRLEATFKLQLGD